MIVVQINGLGPACQLWLAFNSNEILNNCLVSCWNIYI